MIVEKYATRLFIWRYLMLTAAFIVAFLFEIFLPFALGVYVWKKFGASWKVFALGAAAFVVSQIIHIPLLGLYQRVFTLIGITPMTTPFLQFNLINALMLGLLAGICEEPARWIAFKLLKKQGDTSRAALMLGLGHGGVESILVGLSVMNATIALIMWNSGNYPLEQLDPQQQLQLLQLANTPWYLPLLGAFERLVAITLHVSLSLIVWLGVRQRNFLYLLLAILWHTVVNFAAVFTLRGLGWSVFAVEGVMAVFGLLSAGIIYYIVKKYGLLTLYAPEKLNDEIEVSGAFATEIVEQALPDGLGMDESAQNEPDLGN
jgi:uncharacterized membrane protein YhfC